MSKFAILNDTPSLRNKITAELVTDEEGDLKLRINGFLVLYITEGGRISLMVNDVLRTNSPNSFQIVEHIMHPQKD